MVCSPKKEKELKQCEVKRTSLTQISSTTQLSIYHSAVSTFFAPSDLSGVGGMQCEQIHALPSWQDGPPCYDTVLISPDRQIPGMHRLDVTHVQLFFSFNYDDEKYSSALVDWYDCVTKAPGMWIVKPMPHSSAIVHLDVTLQCAHFILVFGGYVDHSLNLTHNNSLDAFHDYYVNKYADHHMHEIVF